ncbi:hypothetical protein U0070_007504, partial [Myodes glareolus]
IPTDLRKELSCSSPQKEKLPPQYPQCSVYGHHTIMGCLDEKPRDMGKTDTILLPIKSHNLETESTRLKLPSGSKVTLLANGAVVGAVASGDRIENPILKVTSARQRETADHSIPAEVVPTSTLVYPSLWEEMHLLDSKWVLLPSTRSSKYLEPMCKRKKTKTEELN